MTINSKAADAGGGIAKAASHIDYLHDEYTKQPFIDQDLQGPSENNHTSALLNRLNHLLMVAEGGCR